MNTKTPSSSSRKRLPSYVAVLRMAIPHPPRNWMHSLPRKSD
jgi:hypothetical protein